jgi:hypothetical protein
LRAIRPKRHDGTQALSIDANLLPEHEPPFDDQDLLNNPDDRGVAFLPHPPGTVSIRRPAGIVSISTRSHAMGGFANLASARNASISGGEGNSATGPDCSVSGGVTSTATFQDSSVSGGDHNVASGEGPASAAEVNSRGQGSTRT